MKQRTVLVVEDESAIREMIGFALRDAGYEVLEAADAASAWRLISDEPPFLILLDWLLPDVNGIELLRRVRREELTRGIPVIMLTAKGEEHDRVRGLEGGADDYLTKPFSVRELVARIHAVLRRTVPDASEDVIDVEGLYLDPASHRVTANGTTLRMGPTEFRLLHFLMTHPERVYSRSQLLDRVWGANVVVEERTVDVHVRRLRKALEAQGLDHLIQTVRGAGYRFSKQV
jgi:two-component system phosphate regulon response regulator PhoB